MILTEDLHDAEANILALKRELWLSHGHTMMYGDDGEMQCSDCARFGMWDWKRSSVDTILVTLEKIRLARLSEPRKYPAVLTFPTSGSTKQIVAIPPLWMTIQEAEKAYNKIVEALKARTPSFNNFAELKATLEKNGWSVPEQHYTFRSWNQEKE